MKKNTRHIEKTYDRLGMPYSPANTQPHAKKRKRKYKWYEFAAFLIPASLFTYNLNSYHHLSPGLFLLICLTAAIVFIIWAVKTPRLLVLLSSVVVAWAVYLLAAIAVGKWMGIIAGLFGYILTRLFLKRAR